MRDKLLPPSYLNIFLVLPIGLHFVLPIKRIVHSPYTYLGFVFILLGLALNTWSVRELKKRNTTVDFQEMPNRLVTDGPFRISRNPLYLGGVILSLGIAILLGSLITFGFPVALLLILDRLYIPAEETRLEKIFGEEYLEYRQKVRRWI
ncbi:MAG: isoprenylcysteine carboxylmethyltransferase family protein [Anaerolineae bacterium]|nr:isoprenylcysteine carboxylmethyltransferase family protein [Anaerolineae bacterium]